MPMVRQISGHTSPVNRPSDNGCSRNRSPHGCRLKRRRIPEPQFGKVHIDFGTVEQIGHPATPIVWDERDDSTRFTGAAGAAGAGEVGLVVVRGIRLNDQVNVVNVDAPGRDIRRNQHVHPAAHQLVQVAGAAGLVEVTVQRHRVEPVIFEVIGELFGKRTGAREHKHFALSISKLRNNVALITLVNNKHAVINGRGCLVLTGHLVHRRLYEKLIDELGDTLVESRREKQPLPTRRGTAKDSLHRLQKPEVTHVIGFIEYGDGDLTEVKSPLFNKVFDSTGCANNDVNSALESTDLACLRHTAVNLGGEQSHALRDWLHGAVNLQCEFASWCKNKGSRLAPNLPLGAGAFALRPLSHKTFHDRCPKRDGFSRSGPTTTEYVAAFEDRRNRRGLNGKRCARAEFAKRGNDVRAQAEIGEADPVYVFGSYGVGFQPFEHHVVNSGKTGCPAVVSAPTIKPLWAVTVGGAITTRWAITTSWSITVTRAVTTGRSITVTRAVTTGRSITVTRAVTVTPAGRPRRTIPITSAGRPSRTISAHRTIPTRRTVTVRRAIPVRRTVTTRGTVTTITTVRAVDAVAIPAAEAFRVYGMIIIIPAIGANRTVTESSTISPPRAILVAWSARPRRALTAVAETRTLTECRSINTSGAIRTITKSRSITIRRVSTSVTKIRPTGPAGTAPPSQTSTFLTLTPLK